MTVFAIFLIVVGLFFLVVGSIGMLRLPHVFARAHALSLTDSLARFDTGDRLHLTNGGWKIERPLLLVAKSE